MSKQNVQVKSLVSLRGISIKGSQCARWRGNGTHPEKYT